MIKTNHFLCRSFRESDLDNVYFGLSHPDVIKFYGISFSSREESKIQMEWYSALEKNSSGKWWAICDSNDTQFYGAVGFNDWSIENKRAELGFWLLPDNWGKGILTEVLPSIFFYGFEKMRLHRIEALVESKNARALNLLEKTGFTHEGHLRDYEIKDKMFIDLEVFSLLSTDNHLMSTHSK